MHISTARLTLYVFCLALWALPGCGGAERVIEGAIEDVDLPVPVLKSGSGLVAVGPGTSVVPGHDTYRVGDSAANDSYVTGLSFPSAT